MSDAMTDRRSDAEDAELEAAREVAREKILGLRPREGVKYDAGKAPYHLVPWDAVSAIAAVLGVGAQKYGARNWERGMDWSRPFAACIRHLEAWWQGENVDQETGLSHLWHAGCCIVFLIAYERRGSGRDDRPSENDRG